MANNPYANEVKYNGQTIMSLRGDTVTPSVLKRGETAHDETGAPIVGTYDGVDLDGLNTSTNEISDSDLFVTKEDGETSWVKKSLLKIWDYISKKLGFFIGTTAAWNALSQSEQDTYNLVFKTDDNINMQSAHDFNVGTTKTGSVQSSISTSIPSTDLVDDAIGTLLNNDATLKDALTPQSLVVTGNGVKTRGQLLSELKSLLSSSGLSLNANSYIDISGYIYRFVNGSYKGFDNPFMYSSSQFRHNYIELDECKMYRIEITSNALTTVDTTNEVVSNGATFTLWI